MTWTLNDLIKTGVTTYTPGTPGTAYNPGKPYTPAYCTYEAVTTQGYDCIRLYDDDRKEYVYLCGSFDIESTKQTCYEAQNYVPPTPYVPAVESQITIDYRLGWNSGARSLVSVGDGQFFQTKIYPGSLGAAAGLSEESTESGEHYAGMAYAVVAVNGQYAVYKDGSPDSGWTPFDGETFRFEFHGGVVYLFVGGVAVYADATAITSFVADTSFYSAYDGVYDSEVGAAVEHTIPADTVCSAFFSGYATTLSSFETETLTSAVFSHVLVNGAVYAGLGCDTTTEAAFNNIGFSALNNDTLSSAVFSGDAVITGQCAGEMLPLDGVGGNSLAAECEGSIEPLTGDSSWGFLEPNVAVASGMISPLVGISIGLTGETTTSSSNTMEPMLSLSSDYEYGESIVVMEPLTGYGFEAVELDMSLFGTTPGFSIEARMIRSDTNALISSAPDFNLSAQFGSQLNAVSPGFSISATATMDGFMTLNEVIGYA